MTLVITTHEICRETGLSVDTLMEFVEYGIVEPQATIILHTTPEQWTFTVNCLCTVQRATRLRSDLGLNWQGIALVLDLLEQRDRLQLRKCCLAKTTAALRIVGFLNPYI
jgi:chaperone modulatory protein CbpM